MSNIKILVVEDELLVSMQISNLLGDIGYEVIDPVTNYDDAVAILNKEKPDIAILDIELEGKKTGIDLAGFILQNIGIPFIFLTQRADQRTFGHAKTLNPSAYLLKPFNHDDLYTSIELALYNFYESHNAVNVPDINHVVAKDFIFIKIKSSFHKVKFTEIIYAKSDHVYMEIYTVKNKCHLYRATVKEMISILPTNFIQIHRSFIINLDFIESVSETQAIIKGKSLPISRNYRKKVLKAIITNK